MEKLIIDIPADKSQLVKELTKALGVKVTEFTSKVKLERKSLLRFPFGRRNKLEVSPMFANLWVELLFE